MLIIAMGIGRFSFTSILPLMQSQSHLTVTETGYLAGSNNLGYLAAAFGAGFITWENRRPRYLRIHLILCIISIGLMGITSSFIGWLFLRFIAGLCSGLIYVLSSSLVMETLISKKREKWVGLWRSWYRYCPNGASYTYSQPFHLAGSLDRFICCQFYSCSNNLVFYP